MQSTVHSQFHCFDPGPQGAPCTSCGWKAIGWRWCKTPNWQHTLGQVANNAQHFWQPGYKATAM